MIMHALFLLATLAAISFGVWLALVSIYKLKESRKDDD